MTKFEDVKGHETAKRAIEIALSGAHSLLLASNSGQGKSMLCQAAGSPRFIGECRLDASGAAADGMIHMLVVMGDISAADYFLPCPAEKSEAIFARVAATQARLSTPRELDNNARRLFAEAYERMHLSPRQAVAVESVARTLAAMDDKPMVTRVHVAEALSYSPCAR